MSDEDNEIPPEVKAEVEKIREEEGGETQETAEESPPERHKLTRRQQKEQQIAEEKAEREAERAELVETARAARESAEETRRINADNAERMARLEGMLTATVMSQRQTVQSQGPEPEPAERIYARKMAEGNNALKDGKMDEYHAKVREAHEALWEERERKILGRVPQPQQPQQQWQKPDWVSAVESQYPDVVMFANRQTNGQTTVALVHKLMFGEGSVATPDSLNKAYERARKELGLGTQSNGTDDKKTNERKRQMLAGGRPAGSSKVGGGSGGGKDSFVKGVPGNWKVIAKRNNMTEAQYLENFAAMNPDNVERG